MSESKFKFKKATPKLVTEYLNIIKDLSELEKQKQTNLLYDGLSGGSIETGDNFKALMKIQQVISKPFTAQEIEVYNQTLEIMKKGLTLVLEGDVENLSVSELKEATALFRKEIE